MRQFRPHEGGVPESSMGPFCVTRSRLFRAPQKPPVTLLLLAVFIEFLAGFIKLSHTSLLPICSLLLADCDDTRCGVTSRLLALFLGVSAAVYCSHLRHINRRHVWAGHLLDAARSAAARRHTCLSTASARL